MRAARRDSATHSLASFGRYQHAVVTGRPCLYHSHLPSSLKCAGPAGRERKFDVEACVKWTDELPDGG